MNFTPFKRSLPLFLLLAMPLGAATEPAATNPQSAYQQAVTSYIQAAEEQIKAIRAEADAAAKSVPEDQRKRFNAAYAKLDECEALLTKLKAAKQDSFDKVKGQFENTRAEMIKALDAARKS